MDFVAASYGGDRGDNQTLKIFKYSQIITNILTLSFLHVRCPSSLPTNSVKALKESRVLWEITKKIKEGATWPIGLKHAIN